MLEKIKKALFEIYGSEEQKWIFLSCFGKEKSLIISQWVLTTDSTLHEVIDLIYDELIDEMQDSVYVVCDVVSEIIQLESSEDILEKDPQEFGFSLVDTHGKSGVMLPAVEWVADAKQVLYNIKKKYWLEWNVEVYVFRTERVVVAK